MYKYLNYVVHDANQNRINKRSYILNFIANILNASFSSIILFIVARFGDISLVGIMSIASTIGYQCLTIGLFGTRITHISDSQNKFSYNDFRNIRMFSTTLMFFVLLYYSFITESNISKSMVIFLFGIYKCIDSYEELLHDEYHRHNRLDISSYLYIIRIILVLIIFICVFLITKNLIFSLFAIIIFSIAIIYALNKNILPIYTIKERIFNKTNFKHLLYILVPIFLTNYIRIYAINIPKYTINSILDEVVQAQYAILIVPVYVINLLSDIIFRPLIPKISRLWNDDDIRGFLSSVIKQNIIIISLTLLIMLGGYVIGLELLGYIYGYNLMEFMLPFELLLLSGGIYSIASFLMIVLTIQGEQNKFLIIYLITTIISSLLSNYLVNSFKIFGAAVLYLFVCCSLCLLSALTFYFSYHKKNKSY